jgi:microcystin degradation protein MlrC
VEREQVRTTTSRPFFQLGNQPRRRTHATVTLYPASIACRGEYKQAYEAFKGELIQSLKELFPLDELYLPTQLPQEGL